ncbi:uncharacterized protein DS421_10g304220 [Arachis hypogaea]|nr:uncharacterized protein DS421_10g304220 [Arachis hypogaea]
MDAYRNSLFGRGGRESDTPVLGRYEVPVTHCGDGARTEIDNEGGGKGYVHAPWRPLPSLFTTCIYQSDQVII